jgi:hypothetical protein
MAPIFHEHETSIISDFQSERERSWRKDALHLISEVRYLIFSEPSKSLLNGHWEHVYGPIVRAVNPCSGHQVEESAWLLLSLLFASLLLPSDGFAIFFRIGRVIRPTLGVPSRRSSANDFHLVPGFDSNDRVPIGFFSKIVFS